MKRILLLEKIFNNYLINFVKPMNLSYEEKVLIKDIFNVRVSREQGYYSYNKRDSESMILLENFINEFGALGPNASLV